MTRSMLCEKQVPREFWPEAVNWTVYVLNRSPTSAMKEKTPEEAWSNVKPSVEHFRVFGCIGYVHIPDQKRKKLDVKSIKCVLLGLSSESKAYKLYNPITKRIVVSRDVVFDENASWEWNNSETESRQNLLEWSDNEDAGNNEQIEKETMNNSSRAENEVCADGENEERPRAIAFEMDRQRIVELEEDENSEVRKPLGRLCKRPAWMSDHVTVRGIVI